MDVFVALCLIILWTIRILGIIVFIEYALALIVFIRDAYLCEWEDSASVKLIIGLLPFLVLGIISWCIGW